LLLIKTGVCENTDFLLISGRSLQMSVIISVILNLELNC